MMAFVLIAHLRLGASAIGALMASILALKLLVAMRHRRRTVYGSAPANLRLCAVVPLHNEDPAYAVACLASMISQTRAIERIHVVDDGSTDNGTAANAVRSYLEAHAGALEWEVTILPENVGKRHALAYGFLGDRRSEVYLCVDSDTLLAADAVAEGLRPFSNPSVTAVAGVVSAHNRRRNLLTRLVDMRYVSAALSERAAYSAFGAVLCCCGSLSFFRSSVVRDNLHDFLNQRFLGQNATFGDDRRLTNYALRAGRVVLAEHSQALTAVPERLSHFVRQQVRWNKSFFRESVWVVGTFPLASAAFWLTICELASWIVFGSNLLTALVILPMRSDSGQLPAILLLVGLAGWARNTAYLEDRGMGVDRAERFLTFAIAPLYGILHIFVLMPARLYALATIKQVRWGTRRGVEVRMSD